MDTSIKMPGVGFERILRFATKADRLKWLRERPSIRAPIPLFKQVLHESCIGEETYWTFMTYRPSCLDADHVAHDWYKSTDSGDTVWSPTVTDIGAGQYASLHHYLFPGVHSKDHSYHGRKSTRYYSLRFGDENGASLPPRPHLYSASFTYGAFSRFIPEKWEVPRVQVVAVRVSLSVQEERGYHIVRWRVTSTSAGADLCTPQEEDQFLQRFLQGKRERQLVVLARDSYNQHGGSHDW